MNLYRISSFLGSKALHFEVFAETNRKGGDVYKILEDYLFENNIPYDRLGFAFFHCKRDIGLFDDIVTQISSETYYDHIPVGHSPENDSFNDYLLDPKSYILG